MTRVNLRLFCAGAMALSLAFLSAAAPVSVASRLEQYRNLGKAFFENATTQAQAVAQFRQALLLAPNSTREKLNYALALLNAGRIPEAMTRLRAVQKLDPKLPHTWFNLGIQYKKAGDNAQAIAQFEQMEKLTPEEPIVHYQLGSLYKVEDRDAESIAEFEQAAKLNPLLAAAQFQLYTAYRGAGRDADAARALAEFQRLRQQSEGSATPEQVDWCNYAEIYDPPSPPASVKPAIPVYDEQILDAAGPVLGIAAIDSTGTGEIDLLVWSAGAVNIYRRGVTLATTAGLGNIPGGVTFVSAGDFDNDGFVDLCITTGAGALVYRNNKGHFERLAANLPARRFERAVWIDYDHDYDLDLILLGDTSALIRNEGAAGFADHTAAFPFEPGSPTGFIKTRIDPDAKAFDLAVFYRDHSPVLYRDQLGGTYKAIRDYNGAAPDATQLEANFNGDGRVDRAHILPDGKAGLSINKSAPRNWISIHLEGVKSLKTAEDAYVEIRAGALHSRQVYTGVPLLFDVAGYATVDTVRIVWPNGLIQNEVRQPVNRAYKYKEAQRLSGSCPMIWTWNGHSVQFITDVLGVAPLGASDGEGTFFPVDHDEYVSIPGSALVPVNGHYDVRVTEELSEVSYLDQIRLLAVDHPANAALFTNEKFKGPPYPEDRLFGVTHRIYPERAVDDEGRDVLARLIAKDEKYPDQFPRTKLGVAKTHTLELDFDKNVAASGSAVLFLNGWVDWPDGSTFRAASQETKGGLVMPLLQMQDATGKWQTVNEDPGMPAGKPKTIAVELRFISKSRKVRIVTSLCVYWDEIFLSEGASAIKNVETHVPLESADLHFRGFSETRINSERKQPDTYIYGIVSPTSFWNPTPGLYTRFGEVKELLQGIDDKPVVMGSGDEIKLRFDGTKLPPLRAGWTRDYLLKVDGWAKDKDPNTAFSDSVEPLPFHGMSVYPYPAKEHFPDDAEHQRYRKEYNTRPALRLIRPLGGS